MPAPRGAYIHRGCQDAPPVLAERWGLRESGQARAVPLRSESRPSRWRLKRSHTLEIRLNPQEDFFSREDGVSVQEVG
ncbi:hypothetical protein D9M72_453000 [compost metagenome]